jgi:hypothetical protein
MAYRPQKDPIRKREKVILPSGFGSIGEKTTEHGNGGEGRQ